MHWCSFVNHYMLAALDLYEGPLANVARTRPFIFKSAHPSNAAQPLDSRQASLEEVLLPLCSRLPASHNTSAEIIRLLTGGTLSKADRKLAERQARKQEMRERRRWQITPGADDAGEEEGSEAASDGGKGSGLAGQVAKAGEGGGLAGRAAKASEAGEVGADDDARAGKVGGRGEERAGKRKAGKGRAGKGGGLLGTGRSVGAGEVGAGRGGVGSRGEGRPGKGKAGKSKAGKGAHKVHGTSRADGAGGEANEASANDSGDNKVEATAKTKTFLSPNRVKNWSTSFKMSVHCECLLLTQLDAKQLRVSLSIMSLS